MRVLLIEDDKRLSVLMRKVLEAEHFNVDVAHDGKEGVEIALRGAHDVAIVDWMLPGRDGPGICQAIRAAHLPTAVLMLTARTQVEDRVAGLYSGADDYLGKPYTFSELHLRIENLLKRRAGKDAQTSLSCGDLTMDLLTRRVTRAGKAIDLLQREFQILEHLLRNKDRVVTRTMLLEQVWDYRFDPHTSLIDTHMSRLRKKIDDGFGAPLLHTIRGVGYRLSEQP